jgi:excisionase family DNA binding protein
VRELARVQPDQGITAILNRLGKRTAHGHTWTEARVCALRHDHGIAAYREGERIERGELTLEETAKELGVCTMTVRRLIDRKILPAQHACVGAPWIIRRDDLNRMSVEGVLGTTPRTANAAQIPLELE